MAWRKVAAPRVTSAVPDELRLGPLLEVFLPEAIADDLAGIIRITSYRTAVDRYRLARTEYLESAGAQPGDRRTWPAVLLGGGRPWSLARAQRDEPRQLAERLRRCGLPKDWRPPPKPLK